MYNPELLDAQLISSVQDALVAMKDSEEGQSVLTNVLNTPSIVKTTAQEHLSSYGNLVKDLPGIQSYFGDKYGISDTVTPTVSNIRIAFEIKEDYTDVDLNPQLLADYVAEETGVEVTLYPVSSEGAIIEALRFGHADIAFMDGGSAWMGWKEYGLAAMAADMKSDGRTYYDAHAVVLNGSEIANAHLDGDDSTDPFALLEGKTSKKCEWIS